MAKRVGEQQEEQGVAAVPSGDIEVAACLVPLPDQGTPTQVYGSPAATRTSCLLQLRPQRRCLWRPAPRGGRGLCPQRVPQCALEQKHHAAAAWVVQLRQGKRALRLVQLVVAGCRIEGKMQGVTKRGGCGQRGREAGLPTLPSAPPPPPPTHPHTPTHHHHHHHHRHHQHHSARGAHP